MGVMNEHGLRTAIALRTMDEHGRTISKQSIVLSHHWADTTHDGGLGLDGAARIFFDVQHRWNLPLAHDDQRWSNQWTTRFPSISIYFHAVNFFPGSERQHLGDHPFQLLKVFWKKVELDNFVRHKNWETQRVYPPTPWIDANLFTAAAKFSSNCRIRSTWIFKYVQNTSAWTSWPISETKKPAKPTK